MKWTRPFGNTAREAKTAWPLASWGARDAGALIRDGYLRNAVAYRCVPVADNQIGGDGLARSRQLMDKAPERLRLTCLDPDKDHELMVVEARRGRGAHGL